MLEQGRNPAISVVVPVHGNAETLGELFRRLAPRVRAAVAPGEVIFVDDCSPDGSFDVLRAAIAGRPTFYLLPEAGLYYLLTDMSNPTPYDFPLRTAFGTGGMRLLTESSSAAR